MPTCLHGKWLRWVHNPPSQAPRHVNLRVSSVFPFKSASLPGLVLWSQGPHGSAMFIWYLLKRPSPKAVTEGRDLKRGSIVPYNTVGVPYWSITYNGQSTYILISVVGVWVFFGFLFAWAFLFFVFVFWLLFFLAYKSFEMSRCLCKMSFWALWPFDTHKKIL